MTNDILRDEWGFTGILMSDWGGSYDITPMMKYGIDLEMGRANHFRESKVKKALTKGMINIFNIDKRVYHIISTCKKYGVYNYSIKRQGNSKKIKTTLEQEITPILVNDENDVQVSKIIDYDGNHNKALNIARESIVLLKNDNNFLPLDKNMTKTITVVGRNAVNTPSSGGGAANVTPYRYIDNFKAIKQSFPNANVKFVDLNPLHKFLKNEFKGNMNWTYNLYNNRTLSNNPIFSAIIPKISDNVKIPKKLKYNRKNYSAKWSTILKTDQSKSLTIAIKSGIFCRVKINDKIVINQWNRKYLPAAYNHRVEYYSTNYQFIKNKSYKIEVEMKYHRHPGFGTPNNSKIRFNIGILPELNKEKNLVKNSDYVIASVGFNAHIEGEGHDRTFALPAQEEAIIKIATSLNDNVIVVLNTGGGVRMTDWIDKTKAVLMAWYQGQVGGQAVAEIINGTVNPSAKLPISIEREWKDSAAYNSYDAKVNTKITYNGMVSKYHEPVPEYYKEGIFVGYRHFDKNNITPLFPFGHGLSYSNFKYSNIKISSNSLTGKEILTVKCDITNNSDKAGAEVIQLYINDKKSRIPRPVKELKGFEKIFLKPNETKTVSFAITFKDLQFFDDLYKKLVAENGRFNILIGSSSRDIKLTTSFELK